MKNILLFLVILFTCSGCNLVQSFEESGSNLVGIQHFGQYGYADKQGNIVIKPQFAKADQRFSEGLAAVSDGKSFFYINPKGEKVLDIGSIDKVKSIQPFREGLAQVRFEDKVNFIDKSGSTIFEITDTTNVHDFYDGLAQKEDPATGKYGFIDKKGVWSIPPILDGAVPFWQEGLAVAFKEEKVGYIDKTGNFVIEPFYEGAFPFKEGLGLVTAERKFGFVNTSGKVVIPLEYDEAGIFYEGLSLVAQQDESGTFKRGYINPEGKWKIVLPDSVTDALNFSEGLAAFEQDDKWGFIDKTGKIVIEPQFKSVFPFKDGLARVSPIRNEWGYIDTTGKFVIAAGK